jgi:4-diphosphocytidyl-2-C-methyl-D-erythritol kinase
VFSSLAFAKINLLLKVTGRRNDGYHLLDSLVGFCEFGDRLEISLNEAQDEIITEGTFGREIDENNIIKKTLEKFRETTNWEQPVRIRLEKEIPIGAGLGGGSSDAATTLRLLSQIPNSPPLTRKELFNMALELGADVPVCLHRKTTRMQGIGEKLALLPPLPELPILLVNPNCRLETKNVFGAFRGNYSEPIDSYLFEKSWSQETLEDLLRSKQQNDLYDAAVSLVPQISKVLTLLRELPGVIGVGMSGSGATCFAIFKQSKAAKMNEALERLNETTWWHKLTYLLP